MNHVERDALIWKMNDQRNRGIRYPDGTLKTYRVMLNGDIRYDLNQYGYSHRETLCEECGKYECDYEGIGHYRG